MLSPKTIPPPKLTVGGGVPIDQAADIHPLSEKSLNAGQNRGKEVILAEGGAFQLDTLLVKNVVFRNTTIFYSGGPMNLENIIFVNCTFILPNRAHSRDFAIAALSNSSITFTSD